jgi:hypothetical protein
MVDKLMVAVEMVKMVNQISSRNGPLDSRPSQKMVYSDVTPKINGHLQNGTKTLVLFTFFWVSILAPHSGAFTLRFRPPRLLFAATCNRYLVLVFVVSTHVPRRQCHRPPTHSSAPCAKLPSNACAPSLAKTSKANASHASLLDTRP